MHILRRQSYGLLLTSLCVAVSHTAAAQSVAPMSQEVMSFSDLFLIQVEIGNTYSTSQKNKILLYDADWKPLTPYYLSSKEPYLGPEDKMVITAMVSFSEQTERQVYICNSITPRIRGKGTTFRGESCGKVIAKRLQE